MLQPVPPRDEPEPWQNMTVGLGARFLTLIDGSMEFAKEKALIMWGATFALSA